MIFLDDTLFRLQTDRTVSKPIFIKVPHAKIYFLSEPLKDPQKS